MATSALRLLTRDELIGFAKSKVMLVMWVVLPLIAVGGYLILPDELTGGMGDGGMMSATAFMSAILASIAGTVAALMVAVDLVSERNRKVYELFVIRPIRRESIIIAKFLAVFVCVTIACIVSMGAGIGLDAVRGSPPTADSAYEILKSMTMLTGVIAISGGVGVLFGVMSRTILVAVVLILYVGQGITVVPMLPMYFGILPNQFWLVMVISALLTGLLVLGASVMFRRSQF